MTEELTCTQLGNDLCIGELAKQPEAVIVIAEEAQRFVPERTCRDEFNGKAWCFKCDTCGCVIPWEDSLNFKTIIHGLLNYCPSCGAKVVEQ